MNDVPSAAPASAVVAVGSVRFGNRLPFALIAGPCAMESRDHALETASALKEMADALGLGLVYKSSFDKANRTASGSARGVGLDAALAAFAAVKERLGLSVTTDVHEIEQCAPVAEIVDPEHENDAPGGGGVGGRGLQHAPAVASVAGPQQGI